MIGLHAVFYAVDCYLETGSSLSLKRIKSLFHFYYVDHKDTFSSYNIDSYDNLARQVLRKIITRLDTKKNIFPQGFGKLTIEEVFFELCRKTDDPLIINVTKVIEREQSKQKFLLTTAGVFLGVGFFGFLTNSFFRSLFQKVVLKVISSAKAVPVLGFFVDTCLCVAHFWMTFNDQKMKRSTKAQQAFFIFAGWFCNAIAYSFIISGASSVPVVGFFFLMSSFLMALNHAVLLTRKIQQLKAQQLNTQQDSIQDIQSRIRLSFGYEQQRNKLIGDVVTSLLMVGIVAISSFVPGGAVVVIPCLSAIALISLAQWGFNKIRQKKSARHLEEALRGVTYNVPISLESPAQGPRLDEIYQVYPSVLSRLKNLIPGAAYDDRPKDPVFQGTGRPFFDEKLTNSKNIPQESEKKRDILLRVC